MTDLPQPIRGTQGATIVGPRNPELEAQNPDIFMPPATDNGGIPNLKFPFAMAHNRMEDGGWAREVTQREMPSLKSLAAVNMRLGPGVIREMHWHKEGEWAYVLQGRVRFYLVDADRNTLVEDLGPGDMWFAPAGIPHAIQGLEEGTEFLLVFDDGNFSENETLLITEWMAHTPREVLAKNFGVPETAFDNIPKAEKYIFRLPVPGPLDEVRKELNAKSMVGSYVFRFADVPVTQFPGGSTRVIDSRLFPATTLSALIIDLEPGAMREMHWHPDAEELQYYIKGKARMTVFNAVSAARTFDFQAGDVGTVPKALGHYIENIGDEPLQVINVFSSKTYSDISLNQWMALTPKSIVQGHLDVDNVLMDAVTQADRKVVPGK